MSASLFASVCVCVRVFHVGSEGSLPVCIVWDRRDPVVSDPHEIGGVFNSPCQILSQLSNSPLFLSWR